MKDLIRLYMQEGESFQKELQVQNYQGQIQYLIIGQFGKINDRLTMYHRDTRKLLMAQQVTFSLSPTFMIYQGDQYLCKFKRHLSILGIYQPSYYIKELNWRITGNFEERTYQVRKNAQITMNVEKYYATHGDFYQLEITNPDQAPLCCLIASLIDYYAVSKKRNPRDDKKIIYT